MTAYEVWFLYRKVAIGNSIESLLTEIYEELKYKNNTINYTGTSIECKNDFDGLSVLKSHTNTYNLLQTAYHEASSSNASKKLLDLLSELNKSHSIPQHHTSKSNASKCNSCPFSFYGNDYSDDLKYHGLHCILDYTHAHKKILEELKEIYPNLPINI